MPAAERLARAALLGCVACGSSAQHGASDATGASDAPPRGTPAVASSEQVCKLLSNLDTSDPTPNDVQFRSNLLGADLGIPTDVGGTLYVLFGDSIGFAGIWGAGESHPDAVGYALDASTAIAANPQLLCSDLRIVSLPPASSIGPSVDSRVQADFAGAAMTAPSGHSLAEFIHDPAGGNGSTFPNLPGDFEVPSGAFANGGSLYVFYTTVVSPSDHTMAGSYLARWDAPSPSAIPAYQILYAVDERFDSAGPLGGDFINIAAVATGNDLYLFGTGLYRASPVSLAHKSLGTLATPGFDRVAAPIIADAGYGETSVRYFAAIDRWMFLAEEQLAGHNRIVARFADRAEGPWSDAIVVLDMADPTFRATYCCAVDNDCQGVTFMNCDRTGFYGSYLLPDVDVHADGSFTVTYTLSSFDPYNVALFRTTFTAG